MLHSLAFSAPTSTTASLLARTQNTWDLTYPECAYLTVLSTDVFKGYGKRSTTLRNSRTRRGSLLPLDLVNTLLRKGAILGVLRFATFQLGDGGSQLVTFFCIVVL